MRAAASVIASLEGGLRGLRPALRRGLAPSGGVSQDLAAPFTSALPADGVLPDRMLPEGVLRGAVLPEGELRGAVVPDGELPDGVPRPLRAPGARVPLALVRPRRAVRTPRGSHWAIRPAPSGLRGRLWRLSDRWRRSLQLRVITATLVLSAVVVSVLGYVLMQHLVTELYDDKVQSSVNIVDAGLASASGVAAFNEKPSPLTRQAMDNLAQQLRSTGVTPYALEVTLPTASQGPPVYSGGASVGFFRPLPILPTPLVKKVLTENPAYHAPQVSWASIAVASGSTPVPGLLIGASFGYDYRYQQYYFFPLSAEQHSIASMQRTLLLVGVAVVFLLVAIAWLVTRWVVIPVRLAAQGARRLAAGALNQRMEVRGTDELAALAMSFNELAASLQEKLAELEDLSQVQRQFVSDVSHELRTPLTTIRIASDVLFAVREGLDSAAGRAAELLQSQLERFESLLTDLLEISRYDANAATLDAEPVDVTAIVRQSADVAQQLAERRGTKIEFRLPAGPCIGEVDRRRVERILRNLLLNAVEHGEDKDVVVTAAMDSAAVAVSVRDYGVGLAPGEEQLVFDRFWRADPARARTSGGTGLGLSIALEDARLHGGWLEAWGEPGKGSVFRLTLPRIVGGELPGSPLPLNPYSAGLDAAGLPGFADLTVPAAPGPDAAGAGQPRAGAEPAAVGPAGVERASADIRTPASAGDAPADGSAGTTVSSEAARG
ncbi:MAG: MtrAB system histidine kinase MtrB [Streptosporangiaceae bacterium]